MATPSTVLIRLTIPVELISRYEEQATELGVSLEECLEMRLSQTVKHRDRKAIYVDDADRQQLERLLGKNVSNASEVVQRVKKALTIKISGVAMELQPHLISRLRSRCFGKPFEDFLAQTIQQELERFCGLR